MVRVYTDGSSSLKNGNAGWGLVGYYKCNKVEKYGYLETGTNNTGELMGIYNALRFIYPSEDLTIYSDSNYCVSSLNDWFSGWMESDFITTSGKKVQNLEIMAKCWHLLQARKNISNCVLRWVKGHSGDVGNETADYLANKGRTLKSTNLLDSQLKIDVRISKNFKEADTIMLY